MLNLQGMVETLSLTVVYY